MTQAQANAITTITEHANNLKNMVADLEHTPYVNDASATAAYDYLMQLQTCRRLATALIVQLRKAQ